MVEQFFPKKRGTACKVLTIRGMGIGQFVKKKKYVEVGHPFFRLRFFVVRKQTRVTMVQRDSTQVFHLSLINTDTQAR